LTSSPALLVSFILDQSGKFFFFCPLWGKNMSDLPEAKLTSGRFLG
jgi:hypothetical protein